MKRLVVTLVLLASRLASADVSLPAVFGDHMVLQEGRPVPLWGLAEPGEKITVTAAGATADATTDKAGHWKVTLAALQAREPFDVTVRGKNTVVFKDVVTGEVWLASGQSNMAWPLHGTMHAAPVLEKANHPRLRLFQVARLKSFGETPSDVVGKWTLCTPETAADFSAVGYFFGRALMEKLDRPVGIIHTSWGGTPAEAWTSREALAASPALKHMLDAGPDKLRAATRAYEAESHRGTPPPRDPGNEGAKRGWAKPEFATTDWESLILPATWEQELPEPFDGAIWVRKEVTVPADWVGQTLTVHLGPIFGCDTTYVNGVQAGASCNEKPRLDIWPRRYTVPASAVRTNRVVIAVRVFDASGPGGFTGLREDLRLVRGDSFDGPSVSLRGEWRYQIEVRLPITPVTRRSPPATVLTSNSPTVLYDGMLRPLAPYGIKGAIWYQGESNTKRAFQYRTLFPAMIRGWRRTWGQGDFPFLFVQLAAYHPRWPPPGQWSPDEWAELREAQLMTLDLPQTGMAVSIDIGDPDDIHPRNKQEVGRRLGLAALAQVYGQEVPYSGPLYTGQTVEKGRLRLRFKHAVGLRGGQVGFQVAGADRRFVAAQVKVEGETVVVSAPTVARPVAARYAWGDAPLGNLTNGANLPASPFRTDKWPALTIGRK